MEANIKEAYELYITIGEQIKELNARRDAAKKTIQGYHDTTSQMIITEDGYKSQIINQITKTLDKNKLIAKFGEEEIADCYTESTKKNFRCDRLLLG